MLCSETMRRAVCPNEACRRPLFYIPEATTHVKCKYCNFPTCPVSELREMIDVTSAAPQLEWMKERASFMEKRGEFGEGRADMANWMIDGIINYAHVSVLWNYFERYGTVPGTGEVKRLSEMGRMEPIKCGYARRLRLCHTERAHRRCSVSPKFYLNSFSVTFYSHRRELNKRLLLSARFSRYGKDEEAAQYLAELNRMIDRENNARKEDGPSLVPSSTTEHVWFFNAAALASRACVGREVFARQIAVETIKNLQKFAAEYKKRCRYSSQIWKATGKLDPRQMDNLDAVEVCDLDLTALANLAVAKGSVHPRLIAEWVRDFHVKIDSKSLLLSRV